MNNLLQNERVVVVHFTWHIWDKTSVSIKIMISMPEKVKEMNAIFSEGNYNFEFMLSCEIFHQLMQLCEIVTIVGNLSP